MLVMKVRRKHVVHVVRVITSLQIAQKGKIKTKSEETSKNDIDNRNPEPENMDTHEMPPPNEPDLTEEEMRSTPTMQEENLELYKPSPEESACDNVFQEILENLQSDERHHVTDCQTPTAEELDHQQSGETSKHQSQAWADSKEESSVSGSEKPQEMDKKTKLKTRIKVNVGPTVYCSFCQVDSHTEDQCDKVSLAKQTAKRKLHNKDSKLTKGESVYKKRKSMQGFRSDLESIVRRGNRSSEVAYIVESEDADELYALYLLSCFGSRSTALTARKLFINGNEEVMARWSILSSEGVDRLGADELLMKAYEKL